MKITIRSIPQYEKIDSLTSDDQHFDIMCLTPQRQSTPHSQAINIHD